MRSAGRWWSEGLGRRAVVLTGDRFDDAKTAHGLLRSSPLFDLVGIVDQAHAGTSSLAQIPDGIDVPVVAQIAAAPAPVEVAIVGIATYGGAIPPIVRTQVAEALAAGIDVVSGLHEPIADDPALATLIATNGSRVVELRAPKLFAEQRFWTGAVQAITTPRLAILGTDCDIGKRTTLTRLVAELRRRAVRVEVVATGQTGLLQGARQGFVLDATPMDFVSGELEHALRCADARQPDLIVVQGQGSFRGPTGQVGPQLLVHTGVSHVIVQHAPGRRTYKGTPGVPISDLAGDLELIHSYGAEVLALTLNDTGLAPATRDQTAADLARGTGVTVIWPDGEGIARLADQVQIHLLGPMPG